MQPVRVLCIGGSDSSGGAGIQADLKAVSVCGCYGLSVITAVTAQNSLGVQNVFPVSPGFIAKQLDSVLSDIGADALKTGMMPTPGVVRAVAEKVKKFGIEKLVVDPVMIAKGGYSLMGDKAAKILVTKLLPLAYVVTPNIPEAEYLTQTNIKSAAAMRKAAAAIFGLGVKNVLIKGGHLPGSRKSGSIDVLYDGKQYYEYSADWIQTKNTHGTGCTYASALAANLARGKSVVDAAGFAKTLVTKAIENALCLGKGHGPVHAGATLASREKTNECLLQLQKALSQLVALKSGRLIPEVSSNLVYAMADAVNENQVAGFPGRIIRLFDKAHVIAEPEFGASRHIAHIVLTVMKYDSTYRSAMNIKFSEEIINVCREIGFAIGEFDRAGEPAENRNKEGFSLEWGVNQVLRQSKTIPDIIYDRGGWGKEPMVRVLGRNPLEVVNKVMTILKNL